MSPGPYTVSVHPPFLVYRVAQRERLARAHARALEQLAKGAAADPRAAAELWLRLAAVEPYNARVTLRLMQALEAAGDRAGALRQARIHAALLEQEFGATVDPEIDALAESLRTAPASRGAGEARSVKRRVPRRSWLRREAHRSRPSPIRPPRQPPVQRRAGGSPAAPSPLPLSQASASPPSC